MLQWDSTHIDARTDDCTAGRQNGPGAQKFAAAVACMTGVAMTTITPSLFPHKRGAHPVLTVG